MILLQRIVAAILGIAFFIAAFVFASALFAVVAVVGLVLWGWIMWRTRALRRAAARGEVEIIEGEYRVEREVDRIEERKD